MRIVTIAAALLCAAAAARAQAGKITLSLEDVELRSAVATVTAHGGAEAAVADEVATRRVTVKLANVTVVEALRALARAADARLVTLAEGVWRIEADPGKEKVRKALETTKVNLNFEETPIRDALNFLAQFSGVPVAVDPEVFRVREPDELLVSLKAEDIKVRSCLELIATMKRLALDIRWGTAFISTPERIAKLPEALLPPPPEKVEEWEAKLRKRLAEEKITFQFEGAHVSDALEFVRTLKNINIVILEDVKARAETAVLDLTVADLPLRDALALMLVPHGLPCHLKDGIVVIGTPGKRKKKEPVADRTGPVWDALRAKRTNVDFEDTPLSEVLAFLSRYGAVLVQLDPEVKKKHDTDELLVSVRATDITLRQALDLITVTKGLSYDVRWGGVVVSTAERVGGFPKSVLPDLAAEAPAWEKKLRSALAEKTTFEFDGASLTDAISFLKRLKGLNIVFEPAARKAAADSMVSLSVTDLPVVDALSHLLVPRGFTFELSSEVVVVRLP